MNKITRSLKSSIAVKNPFQTPVGRYVGTADYYNEFIFHCHFFIIIKFLNIVF